MLVSVPEGALNVQCTSASALRLGWVSLLMILVLFVRVRVCVRVPV